MLYYLPGTSLPGTYFHTTVYITLDNQEGACTEKKKRLRKVLGEMLQGRPFRQRRYSNYNCRYRAWKIAEVRFIINISMQPLLKSPQLIAPAGCNLCKPSYTVYTWYEHLTSYTVLQPLTMSVSIWRNTILWILYPAGSRGALVLTQNIIQPYPRHHPPYSICTTT